MSPRLTRATPQTGVVDVSYARRKRASPARRWHQGEEVGARVAWQLLGRLEGGTMGDDMDAIVPEREMKVEIG